VSQNPPPVQLVLTARDETRAAIQSAVGGLEQMKTSAAGLQGLLVGAAAALGALTVVQQFRSFVSAAAAMDDLAEKTGASVEKLSAMAAVAKISGVSIDVVENSLVRLAKGLAGADEESKGAGNALAALGLKAEDLKNLDTADALKIVADRLNEYKDGAGKTALAVDLLGKAGAQALPYLKDLAETQTLSARITAEQAAEAEELEKNLVRLTVSTTGAWREFSAAVLPTVAEFVKALLEATNKSGGLRDEIKRLSDDGSIRNWAENAALGIAFVYDAMRNLVALIPVLTAEYKVFALGFELGLAKLKSLGDRARGTDFAANALRREKEAAENVLGEATAKFLETPQFLPALQARFAALRTAAAEPSISKPRLDYSSRVDKAGAAAKDDLKAIETYVAGIREQLVGVTDGEFEKMRRKALDTFGAVDFSKLTGPDKNRFAEAFSEVTEAIDTLERRAADLQGLKSLGESFDLTARQAQGASVAVGGFNDAMGVQIKALEFELEMVGKLASERQLLAAVRRIDAEAIRAIGAANAAADPQTGASAETIAQIYARAEAAKASVSDLQTQITTKSRDGFTGLQSAASEYFNRITNDAQNFGSAFTGIMGSLENTFVDFAKTGKFEFKGLVDSIVADLARIVVRQQITAPLAKAVNGALGGDSGGGLFDFILNRGGISGGGADPMAGVLGFAGGGRPPMGRVSIVGEKGPELFVPDVAGTVVPNGGFGGVTINQSIHIDSRSDQASILQAMNVAKEQAKAEIRDERRRTGDYV
jgi:hypothetical protein